MLKRRAGGYRDGLAHQEDWAEQLIHRTRGLSVSYARTWALLLGPALFVAAASVPAAAQTGIHGELRMLTLNIAYAGHASLEQIANAIERSGADVVALQEVDRFTRRRPHDQAGILAAMLGMEYAYAPAIPWQGGEFGLAFRDLGLA